MNKLQQTLLKLSGHRENSLKVIFEGDDSDSRPIIGKSNAYSISTLINKACTVRATALSPIPIHVINKEGKEARPTDPLYRLVENTDLRKIIYDTEVDMCLYGNALWKHNALSFERIPFSKIVVDNNNKTFTYNGEVLTDIIHFSLYSIGDNIQAESPLSPVTKAINMSYLSLVRELESTRSRIDAKSTILAFSQEDGIGDEDLTQLQADIKDKKKIPVVRASNIKAVVIGAQEDPLFVQKQTWVIQEVGRALDVPPPLLEDHTRSTYNNIDAASRYWFRRTLQARIALYESTLKYYLPNSEYNIKFDTSRVIELQPDKEVQALTLRHLVQAGMELKEAREVVGI